MQVSPLLPLHEVIRATSLSKATIYRLLQKSAFPAPLRLSPRRVAWRAEDISAWRAGFSPEAANSTLGQT